eukprot:PhM_4_TR10462/c1_g1_i1/m.17760/K10575/UBE2G1, UBC7; ubiquitin-conjugating enzyme E2 G1
MSAQQCLMREFKKLSQNPTDGFRVELQDESDFFQWTVWFLGPNGTPYEGGHFKASFKYPAEYPMLPPEMTIVSEFWHPNVYPDGKVCMSILHPPVADQFNTEESLDIRWSPVQTIDSILVSFLSLLSDPDPSDAGAPANVDALRQYRVDKRGFLSRCKKCVEASVKALPAGYVAPATDNGQKKAAAMQPLAHRLGSYADCGDDYQFEDDGMLDGCIDDDDDDEVAKVSAPSSSSQARDSNNNNNNGNNSTNGNNSSLYSNELRQLRDMGVEGSEQKLMDVLKSVKGDVSRAMEKLL